ncbi:hypothetical protein TSUD_299890 [Trifolium subterraneum]|uniref:Reverse transcriptase domain-containing protein n=1 Tax=Trifolium subterraneum TaxID=3900 RepID=A0A2Z6NIS2_TRISU|nr:hypothetical protein TSUD_299890 [Trifolium subterraneum]
MSRLDRFLLTDEWCLAWPNCTQTARLRGLSDHCSLVLSADKDDWGPRPSRMLKCWRDVPGYQAFVKDKWKELQVDGWGGYVLKEKLKMIKTTLKDWHTTHAQNFSSRIDSPKVRLSILDQKGEDEARVDNLHFKRLNQMESSSLITPFSEAEVKSAVWDCDSFKSPGPDGVNYGFIKDFWAEIRGDVMRFVSEFHRNDKLTKGINSTCITMIPKIDSPQRLNDFQPISLVCSLYKILAKVLANRLRLVIGSVIFETQTAFVKDRQILDGILIENEVVDEARKCKKDLMLFKPCGGNGLKNVRGLSVLMEAAVAHNLFTGYSIGELDPVSVSHLQFADDTLLLGVESWANVRALHAVLMLFETMSGLKVNFHKSMLVGVNIPESLLGEAASALCCKGGKIPFLYLGLPIGGDPRRLSFWEPVLARLKNKLSGWKSRFLSFGGRLVLLSWKSICLRSVEVWRSGRVERGRIRDGGRRGSTWCREIACIRREGSELGGNWFGEQRFGCLFDLAENKWRTMTEMFSLWWVWMGKRGSGGGSCGWQWQPDSDEGYTVRGSYQLLTSQVTHKSISDYARHFISCSSLLRFWAWGGRVGTSYIHLLQYFWIPLDISVFVDRHHPGAVHFYS